MGESNRPVSDDAEALVSAIKAIPTNPQSAEGLTVVLMSTSLLACSLVAENVIT